MDEEAILVNDELITHKLVRIPGDGACLFASLCYLMHDEVNISIVNRIRAEIVGHISSNWPRFHPFTQLQSGDPYPNVQEYIKDMTRRYTYGSVAELMAAGELFQYEFQVYQNGELRATFGDPVQGVKRIKFSGHFNNGHFDVLIPLNLTLTQEAQIPPIPMEYENDKLKLLRARPKAETEGRDQRQKPKAKLKIPRARPKAETEGKDQRQKPKAELKLPRARTKTEPKG